MKRKGWILFFSLLALVALAMLASSLHDVHFEPGRPAASIELPKTIQLPLSTEKTVSAPLWKIILLWALLILVFILFIYLLPPEIRKRILVQAIRFALVTIAILFALRNQLIDLPNLNSGEAAAGTSPMVNGPSNADVPVFQPPVLPWWTIYLISIGVTLALLVVAWAAYRFWKRLRSRQFSQLGAIAGIARASLDDLAAGHDWGDVIIESYARMSEAVSTRRGLARANAMTPREFAVRLERAGLPANAVSRLTRLFESVRYGTHQSSQADVNEALACLDSILQACGAAQ